ncbi:MAG: SdrD B-like domain-containing protein [Planctomycetota bacterium]|jgi:hypothetical protein
MRFICSVAAMFLLFCTSEAYAWYANGTIFCDTNGNGVIDFDDEPLAGVVVNVRNAAGTFVDTDVTDEIGYFAINLLDTPDDYILYVDPTSLPPNAIILEPENGVVYFSLDNQTTSITVDWLINCDGDAELACWLTGGGVKFSNITGTRVCEAGPRHNFGGNVFPSCDPDPGEGGQWNHVAHDERIHFQGTAVEGVRCGNVIGIEPGSESPVTPFNFIEFWGTGTCTGFRNNKTNYDTVYFFARCEDRNEPGSRGANDGKDIDRYFLHVFSDPADPVGSTLLLVDMDGDARTVDPITITGGNLQIHISSCDDPPPFAR